MLETGQVIHFLGLQKFWGICSGNVLPPCIFIYSIPIINMVLLILERELAMSKKHYVLLLVLTTTRVLNLDVTDGSTAIVIA